MQKHILVVIDEPEYSELALNRAHFLSMHFDLPVKVLPFVYQSTENLPITLSEDQLDKLKEDSQKQLHSFIKEIASKNNINNLLIEVIWHKHPIQYLTEHIDFNNVEFVVKAREVEQHYSSLDWQLIKSINSPLYFVADKTWRKKPNIFIALDLGSKQDEKLRLNEKLIQYGQTLSEVKQCQLTAGYAISISPILRDMGFVFAEEEELKALENIPSKQKELVEKYNLLDSLLIKAGSAEQVLTSMAAKSDSTLVVLGSIGRQGLKGQLIGNTAEKMLKFLKTDLLILSPDRN